MTVTDIIRQRLLNQQIAATKFKQPYEIVNWLIAMQAQEFAMAKWAIGLRVRNVIDRDVEEAFNEGKILRTHLMRPTWHFVSPGDIRWLLALTAPRVNTVNSFMYRKVELDDAIFRRSNNILVKALERSKQLTRDELKSALERKKIVADGFRLAYLLMRAELDGIICSGPRAGKQFTYCLLEERVPPIKKLTRSEALAEFTGRYFESRGPATVKDFAYWSGLTMKECREGEAALPNEFVHETLNGSEYIFLPSKDKSAIQNSTFLMPDYDEYGMSYKDRSALRGAHVPAGATTPYSHWLVVDGKIEGTWIKMENRSGISAMPEFFKTPSKKTISKVNGAIKKYEEFVNKR